MVVMSGEHRGTPALVLIGVSGSGKSTVGARIADKLARQLVETDTCVEEIFGVSVAEMILRRDEHVETKRTQAALSALAHDGAIVTVGASQPTNDAVLMRLQDLAHRGVPIVELVADTSEVARREGLNAPRSVGLGAPRAMLTAMIAQLRDVYAKVASLSVDTCGLPPDEVAERIVAECKLMSI